MEIIGIIPARGGSKGIKRKNIRDLGGKPLIQYSIEAATRSKKINRIVVSTDDDEIASFSESLGASVIKRPEKLAGDRALVMDAIRHVINYESENSRDYDLLVLLEPTAPFRTAEDIDKTIRLMLKNNADSAATFSETDIPPTRIWRISDNTPEPFIEGADPFLPRQSHEKGYFLNGMVYVLKTSMLSEYPKTNSFLIGKTSANIIPQERVVDIDTEMDLFFAEQLLKSSKISQ